MNITRDPSGVFWLGTAGRGLVFIDPATSHGRSYQPDPSDPNSLRQNFVHSIHVDQEGLVCVGTTSEGLNCFDRTTG